MSNSIEYDSVQGLLDDLDTDDNISKAQGILCGFACVKPQVSLQDWLAEILPNKTADKPISAAVQEQLAQIYNNTLLQLNDSTLDFQLLIADGDCLLSQQSESLIKWCQGFLVGLGLCKVSVSDEDVLALIKDLGEISKLDTDILDNEQNAQDLNEIIEFVRMGVLLILEILQPSKQDYISTEIHH